MAYRTACITVLNEAQTIGALVSQLKSDGFEAIVVDNGSVDHSDYIAEYNGAIVYRQGHAVGIGPAMQRAWAVALERGAREILQIDAGGSHDPQEAQRLMDGLACGEVVIGSRFIDGSRYIGRRWRKLASMAAGHAMWAATGAPIADWTSGYRAYTDNALYCVAIYPYRNKMHAWQIEVLRRALSVGLSVHEVPITYRAGRSSMNASSAAGALAEFGRAIIHV